MKFLTLILILLFNPANLTAEEVQNNFVTSCMDEADNFADQPFDTTFLERCTRAKAAKAEVLLRIQKVRESATDDAIPTLGIASAKEKR